MDTTTLVLLSMIPIVAALLAMIALGAWYQNRSRASQREIAASAYNLETVVAQLQEHVDALGEQQTQIVQRLEHLEAIVTSADWDILQNEAIRTPLRVPLDDADAAQQDQASHIAKWVR